MAIIISLPIDSSTSNIVGSLDDCIRRTADEQGNYPCAIAANPSSTSTKTYPNGARTTIPASAANVLGVGYNQSSGNLMTTSVDKQADGYSVVSEMLALSFRLFDRATDGGWKLNPNYMPMGYTSAFDFPATICNASNTNAMNVCSPFTGPTPITCDLNGSQDSRGVIMCTPSVQLPMPASKLSGKQDIFKFLSAYAEAGAILTMSEASYQAGGQPPSQ